MSTADLFGSDSESGGSQQDPDVEDPKSPQYQSLSSPDEDDPEESDDEDVKSPQSQSPAKPTRSSVNDDYDDANGNVHHEGHNDSDEERDKSDVESSQLNLEEEEDLANDEFNEPTGKSVPTQEDIFGEELDVSSDEDDAKSKDENLDSNLHEEAAKEPAEEPVEGVAIEIELPSVDESIGDDIYFVKLPNFLSIETKPFDPAYYEDEIDEDEVLDEEGRSRLKLKVENTIRWRNGKDDLQNDIKESNARIVKWSDGSLSLHMGNEIFDIFKMPIEGLQNHLFVQQGTGLQAKSVFNEKLTFRPHSTKSQTHLKMTMSIADRVSKSQKIRLIPVTERDPEATRQEMTKKEDERLRAQLRRESQQRRLREKSHSKGLTANYLESETYEDDEQELEESLAAIKSRYKKDVQAGRSRNLKDIYSDAESDTDEKLKRAKLDLSSDEEGPRGAKRRGSTEELTKKKRGARKIIESDDDSE